MIEHGRERSRRKKAVNATIIISKNKDAVANSVPLELIICGCRRDLKLFRTNSMLSGPVDCVISE